MRYPDTSDYYLGEYVDVNGFRYKSVYKKSQFFVNDTISNFYTTGIHTQRINDIEFTTKATSFYLDPMEGYFMYELIKLNNLTRVLELGMRDGLSSMYITQAFSEMSNRGQKLVSVSSSQGSGQYNYAGVIHLEKAGLREYVDLYDSKPLLILPQLLKEIENGKAKPFDLIYINGNTLYDYQLLNIFYATMLLKKGGVLIFKSIPNNRDDVNNYVSKNYKFLESRLNMNPSKTMYIYEKIGDDKRNWDFHKNFCS
jgi:predicted O-methyltransferase YrrM